MRRSTLLKSAGLCLLVFASPFMFNGEHRALPYAVVQLFAAGFAVYHLVKYKPRRKSVVLAILVSELCYTACYFIAYFHGFGWLPDSSNDVAVISFYVGIAAMAVTAVAMLAIRRPLHYQEGVLDFVLAVAALATHQWEIHGRSGAAAVGVLTNFILPLSCAIIFAVAVGITIGMFRDARSNSYLVAGQILAVTLAGLGNVGFNMIGESNVMGGLATHTWPGALTITGGFLLCLTLLHPDTPALFQSEQNFGKRLSPMRWLGPIAALVTNPAMVAFLLYRNQVPSLPLAVCSAVLTALVVWRIHRLLADRESARRASESSERRLQSLVEYAADVIVVTKEGGEITYASPGVQAMVGINADEAIGRNIASFVAEQEIAPIRSAMADAQSFAQDIQLKTADGSTRWATVKATDHRTDSSVQGWVWNVHDITDRKVSEEAMSRLALYDQLTGLPNRTQMRDRLEAHLRDGQVETPIAILFCDLDGFKEVNDVLGHEAGDEVLQAVAGRWSAQLRAEDVLGRWGGDEFLVLCPAVEGIETARGVADRLIASLEDPLRGVREAPRVGASIGVVVAVPGEGIDEVLRRADAAMYVAKRGSESLHIA